VPPLAPAIALMPPDAVAPPSWLVPPAEGTDDVARAVEPPLDVPEPPLLARPPVDEPPLRAWAPPATDRRRSELPPQAGLNMSSDGRIEAKNCRRYAMVTCSAKTMATKGTFNGCDRIHALLVLKDRTFAVRGQEAGSVNLDLEPETQRVPFRESKWCKMGSNRRAL